jgi:hypothetical protein
VKSFLLTKGFEIETELMALILVASYGEVPTRYGARPEGSVSKLVYLQRCFRILFTIMRFLHD